MSFLAKKTAMISSRKEENYTLQEYLDLCKTDSSAYASAAERMLKAIGEPEVIDTSKDQRLGRIFGNRTIRRYKAFEEFYGIEEALERVVGFFQHAAQGLAEAKQLLHLLGPVGSAKSTLAEKLKELMESQPIYVLCANGEPSPVFESPLGLFSQDDAQDLREAYDIPKRALVHTLSPWAIKRLAEFDGDITKFTVRKMWPSRQRQVAVGRIEAGDANTQNISALVGKVDLRKLEDFSQHDADAYSYSGALCRGNQGICELVEIFKTKAATLNPLLAATQEFHYAGSEPIGQLPWTGILVSHCFSEDTEILTEHGWKGIDEVNVGDSIATMNRDSMKVEFHPASNKVVRYAEPNEMYKFKSNSTDHLVTSEHKMVYKVQKTNILRECTAQEFDKTGREFPVSAVVEREDLPGWSDDEIRALVWVIADGNVQHRMTKPDYARFHLGKPRKIERLLALCERMDSVNTMTDSVHKSKNYKDIKNLYIEFPSKVLQKTLPDSFIYLSPRQTRIMLTEWSHTDGTIHSLRDNGHIQQSQLYMNNVRNKDIIQHLCAISGHKASTWARHLDGYDDVWSIHIRFDTQFIRANASIQGVVPYDGRVWCVTVPNHTLFARRNGKVLITGNCNSVEMESFRNNKSNEAFVDRMSVVKIPYTLRVSEEAHIYKKLLDHSSLSEAPCAPHTLDLLARFTVLSRLYDHENSTPYAKLRVYNGDSIKDSEPRARSMQEYKEAAGVDEGMTGISTRFAFKTLAAVFNYDPTEIAADPVHLFLVLEQAIKRAQFGEEKEDEYLATIKEELATRYAVDVGKEIQTAYVESYTSYGQNIFERYLALADAWIEDQDFKDPDTGQLLDRSALNDELSKTEKAAGIANPKDFRNEVVKFALRYRAAHGGENPRWTAYEKIKEAIEQRMFSSFEDLLPVISFGAKQDANTAEKHQKFVDRMMERGYTEKQVRRLTEWYMRTKKSS